MGEPKTDTETHSKKHLPVDKSRQNSDFRIRRYALERALAHLGVGAAPASVVAAAQDFHKFLTAQVTVTIDFPVPADFAQEEREAKEKMRAGVEKALGALMPRSGVEIESAAAPSAGHPTVFFAPENAPEKEQAGKGTQRARALRLFRAAGSDGLSFDELAEAMAPVNHNSLRVDVARLLKEGDIALAPFTRPTAHTKKGLRVYVEPYFLLEEAAPAAPVETVPLKSLQEQKKPAPASAPMPATAARNGALEGMEAQFLRFMIKRAHGQNLRTDIAALKCEFMITDGKAREVLAALKGAGYVVESAGFFIPRKNLIGEIIQMPEGLT